MFSTGIIVIVGYFYGGPDINIDINWNYLFCQHYNDIYIVGVLLL